jgi:hypothetical protein
MRLQISVFDVLGRKVADLTDQQYSAGPHRINWHFEGRSGVYFIRMVNQSGYSLHKKALYLK